MSTDEILLRLTRMAEGLDLSEYIEYEELYRVGDDGVAYVTKMVPVLDLDKLQEDGLGHLIRKVTLQGFELHDPMSALVHLGNYHKLFVKMVDMTSGGEKIKVVGLGVDTDKL